MSYSKPLITKPKYLSKKTRILTELFPDAKKRIIQHHLNIAGAQGHEQRELMNATFDTPQEYKDKWKSKS